MREALRCRLLLRSGGILQRLAEDAVRACRWQLKSHRRFHAELLHRVWWACQSGRRRLEFTIKDGLPLG